MENMKTCTSESLDRLAPSLNEMMFELDCLNEINYFVHS